MASGYTAEKKKYSSVMQKEAEEQIKEISVSDFVAGAIYNKFEMHDTRILVGVLTDLLLKKKVMTRKELEADIVSAYKDELNQLRKVRK